MVYSLYCVCNTCVHCGMEYIVMTNHYACSFSHLTSRVQVGSPVTMRLLEVPTAIEDGNVFILRLLYFLKYQ